MEIDVPATSPAPSPSRANYGFTLYLGSTTAFYVFLIWSLMPSSLLSYLYFPQAYWAVAIPVFFLVTLALVGLVIYPAINLCLTPAPEEKCVLTDSHSLGEPKPTNREVPPMFDMSMTDVSRMLYLNDKNC